MTAHRKSTEPVKRAYVCTKSIQWCLTLCNPMDCSPSGSSVHRILQVRMLRVGCHFLLQGIFQTQGWNLCLLRLLHWQAGYLPPVSPGKPPDAGRVLLTKGIEVLTALGIPGSSVWLRDNVKLDSVEDVGRTSTGKALNARPRSWGVIL